MENDTKSRGQQRNKPKTNTCLPVTENIELMKFLLVKLPQKSRNNIKSLLANKQIFVDGKSVRQFNHRLVPGQQVEIRWDRVPEEKKFRGIITIIYEDHDIVVIDKHAGMLSIATDKEKSQTAYNMLSTHVKSQGSGNKIFVVHRLDRETSGLMMFAKSESVQHILQSNWNDIISERAYIAIVEGVPEKPKGTITSYLFESKALIVYSSQNPKDGHKAVTHYQVMKSGREYSMLKVKLETGRKNQVRVHMQDIGHPVIGDKKYGSKTNPIGRLALHAWVLAFRHPINNKPLRFETPVPRKFKRLI
ncbi:MAG: RluA family pseudouridine synthase [Bacteroidales bacterium]|nr:RluA family pseudouridine synthase [Bacteroidales bacterium]